MPETTTLSFFPNFWGIKRVAPKAGRSLSSPSRNAHGARKSTINDWHFMFAENRQRLIVCLALKVMLSKEMIRHWGKHASAKKLELKRDCVLQEIDFVGPLLDRVRVRHGWAGRLSELLPFEILILPVLAADHHVLFRSSCLYHP